MIYVITSVWVEHTARTVGYIEAQAAAHDMVRRNAMDINEGGYYPHAIIEAVEQGFHVVPQERWFYEFDRASESYKLLDTVPKWAEGVACFGLG